MLGANTTSVVFGERSAERILCECVGYYRGRPHRSLRAYPPAGAHWLVPARGAGYRELTAIPALGGLHRRCSFPSARPSPPP